MKNIKKIGLSALAGSLVAFSANAVEMGVTGTAEVTYTTNGGNQTNSNTGNAWGANNSISFSGEGDVGFGTAKIVRTLNDNVSANWLSAWQTLDMGDLGKLSLDAVGGGLEGVTAHDDILPTAYEEVWNGVSGAGVSGAGSNDTIGYSNTFAGVTLSLSRTDGGTAGSADGANDSDGSTGTISDWHLKASVPGMEGLTVAYGESTQDFALTGEDDDVSEVGHVLYSSGPVSVGYRLAAFSDGTAGEASTETEAYALAFNVNDALAISVATQDTVYDNTGGVANVTEGVDAINASYTVGAASVRMTMSDSSNDGGASGTKDEHMEVSLLLAF